MEKSIWADNHFLVKFVLEWPIYKNYRIASLQEFINIKTTETKSLSEEQWEMIENLCGDTEESPLSKIKLIYLENDEIKDYCDPFSDFAQDILIDFYAVAKTHGSFLSCSSIDERLQIATILNWVNKYGAPFSFTSRPVLHEREPQFYLEEITRGAGNIEDILFDAFGERVILINHVLWCAREVAIIMEMLAYCNNKIDSPEKEIEFNTVFKDLIPENFNKTAKGVYLIVKEILQFRMSENLSESTLLLSNIVNLEDDIKSLLPFIKPRNLLGALWLKLDHQLIFEGPINICEECGLPFKKTRNRKRFCSITCGERSRKRESRKNKKTKDKDNH